VRGRQCCRWFQLQQRKAFAAWARAPADTQAHTHHVHLRWWLPLWAPGGCTPAPAAAGWGG
jgi:hypothetical protein